MSPHVIASAAKQSSSSDGWIASSLTLLAMTRLGGPDFVTDDNEFGEVHPPETRRQRHVGGVAPGRHQDAADPRHDVTGIEGIPPAREISLEPAGEIHRLGIGRNADVAHVAGAIARRHAHATAKGERKMREIAADAG